MSYSPAPSRLLIPDRHSIDTLTSSWTFSGVSGGTWGTANQAIYAPIAVPSRVLVRKLWFASQSVGTGNVDMALYTPSGVAVIEATATAKIASSSEQVFDVTDTLIDPGLYYIGLSCSNATDTFGRMLFAPPFPASHGVYIQASAYPLPSTATFNVANSLGIIPAMGLLLEATTT